MTWLRLALANLTLSPLTTAVNVLLMALGVASIVLLLLAGTQLSETMSRDAKGIDLVIGAQGSPVQLVLSSVYHADVPTGNIALKDVEPWANDSRVGAAVPLSLGDSIRGFRIVGTTQDYLSLFDASVREGRVWQAPMEAVLGSAVSEALRMGPGATFAGAHGLVDGGHAHDQQPYRVVGVLAPTGSVVDRLVVTSLDSVWVLHDESGHDHAHGDDDHDNHEDASHAHGHHEDDAKVDEHVPDADEHEHHSDDHEHHSDEHAHHSDAHEDHSDEHEHHSDEQASHTEDHDHHGEAHADHGASSDDHAHADGHDEDREITAMLLTYRTPMAAVTLPRAINASGTLLAAAPALEIARILNLVGLGLSALGAFAWVLVATAALSIFAALYGSLRARRGELAMLRCLGASRSELLGYLIIEGLVLTVLGIALGFIVGHVVMEWVGAWLADSRGVTMTGWLWIREETWLIMALLIVGVMSAIVPAIQAYRTDVARTLAEG